MSKRTPDLLIQDIIESAQKILEYTKGLAYDDFKSDSMRVDAVIRNFEIIGEAANNISLACQNQYPQIPWREMVGMRNRIVHAYFEVDLDVVWQVIIDDLPKLLRFVNQSIQELEK
jgi:uncharacterized protein with HEPN domain